METRVAVVVFPPREEASSLEEFRRTNDPLFHKVAAHVAVVTPFTGLSTDAAIARLRGVLETRAQEPFDVSLGGAGRYDDGVVFVRVGEGAATLTRLHDALSAAVEPPDGLPPRPFVPHCTVGRGTGPAEAAFLERQAAGRLRPLKFRVDALAVLVEDARGLWLERGRLTLARRATAV
ncbi:MAG: 2'-5' RNA ligase family protein [Planctomycetota bacterium]